MDTGDQQEIWVNVSPENHKKLLNAFLLFGLPVTDLSAKNFLKNNEVDVFTYGIPPACIEILKSVKGCDFAEAYKVSNIFEENDLKIRFLHRTTLIKAKTAAGRYKDLDDIEKLSS